MNVTRDNISRRDSIEWIAEGPYCALLFPEQPDSSVHISVTVSSAKDIKFWQSIT